MYKAIIRKYLKLLLAMVIVCALGIGVMTGLSGSYRSLQKNLDQYVEVYGYPDAVITTDTQPKDKLKDLLEVEGVEYVDARLAGDTVIEDPENNLLSVRVFSYSDADHMQMHFWANANPPEDQDAILVEHEFARHNHIQAGDTVKGKIGEEYRPYFVEGIVSLPEALSISPNNLVATAGGDSGYVYVHESVLAKEEHHEKKKAIKELDEKSQELQETRAEAENTYQEALDKIEDGRKELNEIINEFAQTKEDLEHKLDELNEMETEALEKKDEILNDKKLLESKKEEALEKKEELEELKKSAESKLEELNAALKEADSKEAELLQTQNSLEAKKADALKQKEEVGKSLAQLKEAKEGLQKIDAAKAEAQGSYNRLTDAASVNVISLMRTADSSITLSLISQSPAVFQEFANLCGNYGIAIDINQSARKCGPQILHVITMIEGDYAVLVSANAPEIVKRAEAGDESTLSSKEYKNIENAVSRYVSGKLTANRFQKALDRVIKLYDYQTGHSLHKLTSELINLIENHGLLTYLKGVSPGASMTWLSVLQQVAKINAYAGQLSALTGLGIVTIGDFVRAYDAALANTQKTISDLDKQRSAITKQLEAQGVKESQLDKRIAKAEGSIPEINAAIEKIQAGLSKSQAGLDAVAGKRAEAAAASASLKDKLAEIEAGLLEIETKLKEAEENSEKIKIGLAEIEDALLQVKESRKEIEQGLSDSEKEIQNAEENLSQQATEVNEEWAKNLKEFNDLELELQNAYGELDDIKDYHELCNQFLLHFSEGSDPEKTLGLAKQKLGDAEIKESFVYEDSPVRERIRQNVDPIRELAVFMPWLFFIVVLIVLFLFMSTLVLQSRKDIGILRALGFSKNYIRGVFSLIGFLISAAAYLPGLLIGWGLITLISNYFYRYFPLPFAITEFDVTSLFLAFVITAVTVQIATLSGTTLISRIQPAEGMSRQVPVTPSVPRIITFFTRNAGELVKFSIISMLRNVRRFIMTIICIAATVVLIYSSMSFLVSKDKIVHQTYDQRILYDCEIFLSKEASNTFVNKLKKLSYVTEAEKINIYYDDVSFNDKSASVLINTASAGSSTDQRSDVKETETNNSYSDDASSDNKSASALTAASAGSSMNGIFDKKGDPIEIEESGIVLDRFTAKQIGASKGDTVLVGKTPVKIIGLSDQAISRIQYVSWEQGKEFGAPSLGAVLVRLDAEHHQDLVRYLIDQDNYLTCSFTEKIKTETMHLYETYDLYAWILVGFAIVIGLLIVVNISRTILIEQKRELCVLRTLGFKFSELSANLFSQALLRFIFAMLLGIPIGGQIARYSLSLISTSTREFIYASGVREILLTSLIVFIYVVAAHIISTNTMKKWDIVEVVKEKE